MTMIMILYDYVHNFIVLKKTSTEGRRHTTRRGNSIGDRHEEEVIITIPSSTNDQKNVAKNHSEGHPSRDEMNHSFSAFMDPVINPNRKLLLNHIISIIIHPTLQFITVASVYDWK